MKNAEITLVNLANVLFDDQPSNYGDFAENINAIYGTAMRVAKSKACQSLVGVGNTITAFVKFGDSIAAVSRLKLSVVLNL